MRNFRKILLFLGLACLLLTVPVLAAELPPDVEDALPREAGKLLDGVGQWDAASLTDGLRSIWVHLKLKYITSVGEKHIIVGTLTDITEQRMMDQELQKYRQVLLAAEKTERTMLVVDDQEVNRGLLKCIFEQQYRILEAENGADAFEVLNRESGKVDIILLDLAMPVMDGMEFLKRKQQDAVLAGIPVIIITADDTTGHQIQMLQLGAEDYIVKPFVPEIAMRRVENVLGAGRLLKRMSVAGGKDKGETDNGGTV